MSFGSLANHGFFLDAAPRAMHNVFAGPLSGGRWAALLLNRGIEDASVSLDFSTIGLTAQTVLEATEVWSGARLGAVRGQLTSPSLAQHASLFVILTPKTPSRRRSTVKTDDEWPPYARASYPTLEKMRLGADLELVVQLPVGEPWPSKAIGTIARL